MTRLALLTVLLTGLLAAGAATAVATPQTVFGHAAAKQSTGATMGNVSVRLDVKKFAKSGQRLIATGTAIATYTPQDGSAPTVVRHPFTARVIAAGKRHLSGVQATGTCQVLTLQLDQLALNLLGLHVDLSKVVLTITADPNGGVLGRVFCSVVNTRTLASVASARTLSSVAQRSRLSTKGVGFGVPTRQGEALAPGPCSIVDLLLGPLHLELLGLIVDLNQIHLQITADPNGGILGSLLCSITNPPPTTTTVA